MKKFSAALLFSLLAVLLMGAAASTSLVYVDTTSRALTGNIVAGNNTTISASGNGTITATAAPLSGLTGLGTGVGTFLATPSSANLASAVTDETGSGSLVFANTPTLVTPNIGAATGTSVNLSGNATVGGTLTVSSSATVATNLSLSNVSGYNFLGFNNAQNLSTATGIYSATGDGNLYLNVPTTYTVRARINGSDKLTVSSTSTNIEGSLTVKGPDNGSLYLDTSSATNYTSLYFKNNGGSNAFGIYHYTGDASTTINSFGGNLIFSRTAGELGRFVNSSGNLLLGTTTDSGQKLQVAGSAYAVGNVIAARSGDAVTVQLVPSSGISSGADISASNLALSSWANLNIRSANSYFYTGSGSTLALTLDSSQNATFAGTVRVATKLNIDGVDSVSRAGDGSLTFNSNGGNFYLQPAGLLSVTISGQTGSVRFNQYGAGTLSTDANGVISASSDARLKTNLRTFARGLADVLKLAPKLYNWNEASGLDTENDYVGFVAQDVQTAIPEAVYEGKDQAKTLTLNDRAILAALVNAVKELNAKVAALEAARN